MFGILLNNCFYKKQLQYQQIMMAVIIVHLQINLRFDLVIMIKIYAVLVWLCNIFHYWHLYWLRKYVKPGGLLLSVPPTAFRFLKNHTEKNLNANFWWIVTNSCPNRYLNSKCTQYNSAKNRISEDAIKDISFAMDFPCVDFIEKLHHDKGVEDNGVMLWRRRVKWCIPPTVNLKHFLT